MSKYAIVALQDGTVKAIELDKYLASQMTILEETETPPHQEKIDYWDRVVNYKPSPDQEMFHFYNKTQNKHLWSIYKDPEKALKGLRDRQNYKLLNDF